MSEDPQRVGSIFGVVERIAVDLLVKEMELVSFSDEKCVCGSLKFRASFWVPGRADYMEVSRLSRVSTWVLRSTVQRSIYDQGMRKLFQKCIYILDTLVSSY